jgi:transcriptional regulator with GAF, ATPase, and Fis domain
MTGDALRALTEENLRLTERLAAAERERDALRRDFAGLEQRHNDLANLYVAADQLHGTCDEKEVVAAIEEIVINLIGCEQFGVFDLDPAGGQMRLIGSFGLSPDVHEALDASQGVLGRAIATGEIVLTSPATAASLLAHERGLTACVPLKVSSRVAGAIVLFDLLPQKSGRLTPVDNELLALLSAQAGSAVYASRALARSLGAEG